MLIEFPRDAQSNSRRLAAAAHSGFDRRRAMLTSMGRCRLLPSERIAGLRLRRTSRETDMNDRRSCQKTRRLILFLLLFALARWFLWPSAPLAHAAAGEASESDGKARPPNIIFLLTDDVRYDALAAAGNTIIQTPHLDRLAMHSLLCQLVRQQKGNKPC